MKDSQPNGLVSFFSIKYIKADNERFSTEEDQPDAAG